MLVQSENVEQLVQSVWRVMLQSELSAGQPLEAGADPLGNALYFEASIRGEWNGRVVLGCTRDHAQELLSKAARRSEESSDKRMAEDLVAELVNIVTGNLKGSIGGDTVQSTPVAISSDESHPAPGEQSLLRLCCDSDGNPVLLAVMTQG